MLAQNQVGDEGEFPVIGFIKDPTGVAALYLGKQGEGPYMGKVGTGWSRTVSHQAIPDKDQVGSLITDAYATVAIAYRRASAAYTANGDMQQLGTAAVHLLTIATSYIAAQPKDAAQK